MSVQVKDRLKARATPVHRASLSIGLSKIEVLAAALTAAVLISVIVYYMVSLRPIQSRVDDARARLAAQQKIISGATTGAIRVDPGKEQIERAKASLGDFEDHDLKPIIGGRIQVIDLINAIIKDDKLHLGSGLDMHLGKIEVVSESSGATDQPAAGRPGTSDSSTAQERGSDSGTGSKSSANKKSDPLDVFPRVQFRFTVAGPYDELRKFIKDLQSTKDFLVIDSIALASAEAKSGRGSRAGGNGGGLTGAGVPGGIALTATVTAYFRPDQPVSAAQ
ncbi:MAG TPA: GspMb/PilO family protein [Blastocatellia bacterium]